MLRAGITGGIGSGKSLVCAWFEKQQVPVYYADKEASALIDHDPQIKKKLKGRFGQDAYHKEGLNKPFIRSLTFKDKTALEFLNAVTHPPVLKHFADWCLLRKKEKHPFIIKEAALVFESESYKQLDFVACVVAPLEVRIERTMKRDKLNREQVMEVVKRQMPDEEKIKRSQFIIHNPGNELLLPQIVVLHQTLLNHPLSHGK